MAEEEKKVSVGQRVVIQGKLNLGPGTIRYVGLAKFQTGRWVGIELDTKLGKNDGEVQGERYFECKPEHGIFVKPVQDGTPLEPIEEPKPKASPLASSPGSSTPRGTAGSPSTPRGTTSIAKKATTTAATKTATSTTDPAKKVATKTSTSTTKTSTTKSPTTTTTSKLGTTKSTTSTATKPKTSTTTAKSPISSPRTTTKTSLSPTVPRKSSIPSPLAGTRSLSSSSEKVLDSPSTKEAPSTPAEQPEEPLDKEEDTEEGDDDELLAGDYEDSGDSGAEDAKEEEEPETTPAVTLKAPEPVVIATPPTIDLGSFRSDSVDRMMQALKELNEFKVNAQETIQKLQQNCNDLTTQRDKLVKEHEKEKQRLIKEHEKDVKQQSKQGAKEEKSNAIAAAWEKEKQELQEQLASVNENLEMLTLDKEIAEQKAEELENELTIVKEELDILKTDVALAEEEKKSRAELLSQNGGDGINSEQYLELMAQNEKLKDALVKLRDVALNDKQENTKKSFELEKATKTVATLQEKLAKAEEELKSRAEKIEELGQQVDDNSGAQDMVEELSEKNGKLEEKLEELQLAVEELESLKDVADELEENHVHTEKQLQHEIYLKDVELINREGTITNLHLKIVDQEATITNFRDLVNKLQTQITNMRSREEEESAQRNEIANRERVLMSQNIQLQSKMLKVVAMEVDQQLEKMKATESALQYQFAKAFLPERGFQVDTESLRVILAAKRIAAKANIIKAQVQKLNTPESIIAQLQSADSNAEDAKSPDAIIHALKVEEQLTILANVAADFEDTIAQCDVELYVKLGKLVYDIEPCERTLDILLTLVRDEEFGSGYSVAELEKLVQRLGALASSSLGGSVVRPVWRTMQYEAAKINYSILLLFVESAKLGKPTSDEVSAARVSSIVDYCKRLSAALSPQAKLRRSPIVIDSLIASQERARTILNIFTKTVSEDHDLTKLSEILDHSLKGVFAHTSQPEEEDLSSKDELDRCLAIIRNNIRDVVESLTAGDLELSAQEKDAIAAPLTPWSVRGQQMQDQLSEVGTLRETLSQKDKITLELQKQIKLKEQEVQDEKWKVESLDRLAKNAKKVEEEYAGKVAAEVEKSKKQEKVYEQALESMRQDHAKLEQELSDLRRKNIGLEKGARTATSMNLLSGLTEKISSSVSVSSTELEALRSAIRFLRNENARLQAEQAQKILNDLPELPEVTHHRLYGTPAQVQVNDVIKYGNEVNDFLKETYNKLASANVIKLQAKPAPAAATPAAPVTTPAKHQRHAPAAVELLQLKQVEMATLQHKGAELKEKMAKLMSGEGTGSFAQFPNTATTKAIKESQPTLVGKILLPSVLSLQKPLNHTQKPPRIVFNNLTDFAQLHSVFVQ